MNASVPIRVMVCDDSFTIRSVIARILRCDPEIEVACLAADGQQAIDAVERGGIDVVVLDVAMPVLDGLAALPRLLKVDPTIRVIMASSLTTADGRVTMQALQAGASDYVPKPTAQQNSEFAKEILAKVKGQAKLRRLPAGTATRENATAQLPQAHNRSYAAAAPTLRAASTRPPLLLAIGSSTGGPQALFAFFKALSMPISIPIVVTQHMPPLFTRSLAEHIARIGPRSCVEATDEQTLSPDQIVIAPGDRHLLVEATERGLRTRITDDAPENSCRPAVDPMLRSASDACRGRVLAVILTGMGQDGLRGAEVLVQAGGCVLAQDEASSVVWGMPGAVARAGLCHAILPVEELAGKVKQLVKPN